jgi:hypothetical protein
MQSKSSAVSLNENDRVGFSADSTRWLLASAVLGFLLMIPDVITRPLFGDDAYYIWGATQIHQGCYPIRDFFAIDPAGAWGYFCVTRFLFGEGSVGYWIMVSVSTGITAILLGLLARNAVQSLVVGIWVAFLFIIVQLRCTPPYALVGKDMIGFPFVLGGMLLGSRARWWLPANLLVGIGLAIKPTLGAIWLFWMVGDFWLHWRQLTWWVRRAAPASVAIGIPFLAATLWAERHGWGWAALKVNTGLSAGYGAYLSGANLYKFSHVFLPMFWMFPMAALALRSRLPFKISRHQVIVSVLLGGLVNWVVQPMFNSWYFIPFFSGIVVMAGIGLVRIVPRISSQVLLMFCAGLFFAFVPSTNLRWIKLLGDVGGKEKYTLVEHQSRLMVQYGTGNTPPYIQNWVRNEVAKMVPHGAMVGITVTDGDLLWALRDYRPGFWAVWSPSWNPEKLAEGLKTDSAEVVVGVESQTPGSESAIYYNKIAQLQWNMPDEAIEALAKNYQEVTNHFGYVIYRRREQIH